MVTTSSGRGFQVPTVSGDSNIWGGELNTTIGALDTILGGSLTLFSSAATSVTLSSSQAQFSRLVVQGLVAGNAMAGNFTLTFPSANYALGNYQVWNNTLGPGGVVCVGATGPGGGATCTVNAGALRLVNVDGTNAQLADNQPTTTLPTNLNKFRNPAMDIFQRGPSAITITAAATPPAYTLDGWQVGAATGAPAVSQVYNTRLAGNALRVTGNNAAMTSLVVQQNIESYVAAQLLGSAPATTQVITIQFTIYNNSGGSFTPQLSAGFATAQDNFATVTNDLAPVNLQACANGALTTVAYTFTPSASLANGYQVALNLGTALNNLGGTIDITRADIRVTPGVAVGVNSSPPAPEMRPIQAELVYCQRYLFVAPQGWWFAQFTPSGAGLQLATQGYFPTQMRALPSVSAIGFSRSNVSVVNQPANGRSQNSWAFQITSAGAGQATGYILAPTSLAPNQFSAEL